jgi:SAM-dependent methyltransferase
VTFRAEDRYRSNRYLASHPTWHVEDSVWKAQQILVLLERLQVSPATICEIGCGAGAVLEALERKLPDTNFVGYDIAPAAIELARGRETPRLRFVLGDVAAEFPDSPFDVALVIDVVEHVEDPFAFLRSIQPVGRRFIMHIPLELSVQSILRRGRLSRARQQSGHLHFFTLETALDLLDDCDYAVVDSIFTASALDTRLRSRKARVARAPRALLYRLDPRIASLTLGGCSILVAAEPKTSP